jgi:altronate dehydratase
MSDVSQGIVALVTLLVTALGNKLWNKVDAKAKARLEAGLSTMESLMRQLVNTSSHDTSVSQLIVQLKAIAAIQLAKIDTRIKLDNPLVAPFIDKAIAAAVDRFVANHPTPRTLALPIREKIPKL